jgi:hypothetical protein
MITGCYTLHLYCDAQATPECPGVKDSGIECLNELTAERGEDCRNDARAMGWSLSLTRGVAVCPSCVKAGHTAFTVEPNPSTRRASPSSSPPPANPAAKEGPNRDR